MQSKINLAELIFSIMLCIGLCATFNDASAQRTKFNFNTGWKLMEGDVKSAENMQFNDTNWKNITLPQAFNEDEAFRVAIDDHSTNIVWYRKRFKVPQQHPQGQKVFLEFEGIRQAGDFYLNGHYIGKHENGAMAFGFDVSELIRYNQENVISVRIDNSWEYKEVATQTKFQWINKNFNANYGGITKNVYLHVTGKLHQTLPLYSNLKTTGVYIYAKEHDVKAKTATIVAESEVKNDDNKKKTFTYEVKITNLDGKTVKTFSGDPVTIAPKEMKVVKALAKVSGLEFWSWGYGYLYTVTTTLREDGKVVDAVNTVTGFRKTAFTEGMVRLNDRVLQMKGYAQRTSNEWPAVGMSVPAWMSDYSNQLMVESNANLVRWMHITPWKQDIESCDRLGLIQAMQAGDAEKDVQGEQWNQRVRLMRDAIIYNRNNPSILFYESGNESISEEHMLDMKAVRDKYDPHGGRAVGSREMLDSKVAEYGGEMLYVNKSAHIPMWAMEYSRDEGLRKYWDNYSPPFHIDGAGPLYKEQDASVYNRNQDTHAIENIVRWYDFYRERPGTGKRSSAGGVNIIFSDSNTHFRGEENYRRSGEVDAMRIPKDGYYAHQVMWDGWVDVEKPRTHLIGHWNYTPETKKDVFVVSSGAKVELFINGVSKGFGLPSSRFLYTFKDIQWQPGTIRAVSYDKTNKEVAVAELKTAGKPAAIRLTLIQGPKGFKADGADLALIEAEVVDADGNRCPTALNMLNFDLEGAAEWRGGIAQGPDNYILAKSLPVEGGVNRIIVRSTAAAGQVTLKVTADGLKSNTLTFKSTPVKQTNGLSLEMPASGLSSYLKRGPTPKTPSYVVSRHALKIVSATAGSNNDKANLSYDDNELSDWFNDGNLTTAWINYNLDREALISEVTIKLNNFRSRNYPLRITVDGKEAFNGLTAKTLGYYTVKLKPQRGKTLKIELLDATALEAKDAFGMVEITGKKLDDGVARNDVNTKGRLSIVEIEIYEGANAEH
jgi:beta-galactosidase